MLLWPLQVELAPSQFTEGQRHTHSQLLLEARGSPDPVVPEAYETR